MPNNVYPLNNDDVQLQQLDISGGGSGIAYYGPGGIPVQKYSIEPIQPVREYPIEPIQPVKEYPTQVFTPTVYPTVIETLATTQMPREDYLPEECIDCNTPPAVTDTINDSATTTAQPATTNKFFTWIKANPVLAAGLGFGFYLLFADNKKKKKKA